jgi:hypothetical protein
MRCCHWFRPAAKRVPGCRWSGTDQVPFVEGGFAVSIARGKGGGGYEYRDEWPDNCVVGALEQFGSPSGLWSRRGDIHMDVTGDQSRFFGAVVETKNPPSGGFLRPAVELSCRKPGTWRRAL